MGGPWKKYTSRVYKEMHYLGSWPLAQEVSPGDIGVFEGRTLERQKTIAELGLEPVVHAGTALGPLGFLSGGRISLEGGAEASAPLHPGLGVEADARVTFGSRNGVLLRAEGCREDQLDRLDLLRQEMLRLDAAGEWDPDWIVVTHVIHARRASALVAEERGASVALRLGGALALEPLELARAEGTLTLGAVRGSVFHQSAEEVTPLYLALRVGRKLPFAKVRVRRADKRGRARPRGGEAGVVDVTF
jgi:hypothetical protein